MYQLQQNFLYRLYIDKHIVASITNGDIIGSDDCVANDAIGPDVCCFYSPGNESSRHAHMKTGSCVPIQLKQKTKKKLFLRYHAGFLVRADINNESRR